MIIRGDFMQFKSYCAANSGEGFISFFDTLTDERKSQVFYIKGGPGSGKSTFLKRIASMAKNAEIIYCSGDPSSLDGVVLPEQNTFIFDATAPHNSEPKFPGVGGNLIDLGEGWDIKKMNKEKIIHLSEQKSEVYKSCYSLLKSAKYLHSSIYLPLNNYLEPSKLIAVGERILKQYALWESRSKAAKVSKRFFTAISPDGRITLNDTIELFAEQIIIIEDRWMIGHRLMQFFDEKLSQNGIDHINGYNPLLGKNSIQQIIIPEVKIAFVIKDGVFPICLSENRIARRIVYQNYISKDYLDDHRNKLSFIKKMMRDQVDLACEKLADARRLHMNIEAEYLKGTNFERTEALKQKIIDHLFT